MSIGMILLILLVLMLVGVLPTWPHSRQWGFGPSGGLGLILLVIVVLLHSGRSSQSAKSKKNPGRWGRDRSGGGGGNRTPVRKPFTGSSTCVARPFGLTAAP